MYFRSDVPFANVTHLFATFSHKQNRSNRDLHDWVISSVSTQRQSFAVDLVHCGMILRRRCLNLPSNLRNVKTTSLISRLHSGVKMRVQHDITTSSTLPIRMQNRPIFHHTDDTTRFALDDIEYIAISNSKVCVSPFRRCDIHSFLFRCLQRHSTISLTFRW
jgi:hypothetical protein